MTAPPDTPPVRIGTAAWQVTREEATRFPAEGTHLQRYAARMNACEINSSFYRAHTRATYERWAAQVPEGFRFAVKLPRTLTHGPQPLAAPAAPLDAFMAEVAGLGARLGCLLLQLPPRLAFDAGGAGAFLEALRARHDGDVACEPRHASWFTPEAEALLRTHRVARVRADPVLHAGGEVPGGWPGLVYVRLHGSPRVYWSRYDAAFLSALAARCAEAAARGARAWCILDNTAGGGALGDALALQAALREAG